MDTAALQGVPQHKTREIYEYDVPAEFGNDVVKKTIALAKLRGEDEVEATKRASGDSVRLAFELVKLSIVEIDGRKVNHGEGEEETIWNGMEPKLRQLALAAYADLHTPSDSVTANFLKAKRMRVG